MRTSDEACSHSRERVLVAAQECRRARLADRGVNGCDLSRAPSERKTSSIQSRAGHAEHAENISFAIGNCDDDSLIHALRLLNRVRDDGLNFRFGKWSGRG
jgi:hypothetical protein